jgi:hypothetical protein
MENLRDLIAELKRLSNLEHCQCAHDMQGALEDINDLLNAEFPDIDESE